MVLITFKGAIFLLLLGPGIVGNIFVFVNYLCIFFGDTEKKCIHLVLMHLSFINIMVLFCRGLSKTMAFLGLGNFLDDTGCQIVVFLDRMGRGLSISTTSLLTTVQAITMSPRSSRWARLKPRSSWHLLPFFAFFWVLSSLISTNLLYYIRNVSNLNKFAVTDNDSYCYFIADSQETHWMLIGLKALHDGLFQSLMCWTSVYILYLLHKHHRQTFYLQRSRILDQTPAEIRAAQSVFLLMCCFLFFYWTETTVSLYLNANFENQTIAVNTLDTLSIGYGTLSPFVLIHRDAQLTRSWYTSHQPKKTKSCMQND